MGGSSSRELSRRGSKQRRKKEQSQWSSQREVLPSEYSPDSYNASDSRHYGSDEREAITYLNNQFQNNQWEVEEFNFEVQRDFYSENRNSFYQPRSSKSLLCEDSVGNFRYSSDNLNGFLERQSFATDRNEERQIRQPKRRHHSFSENRLQYQSGQGSFKDLSSSRVRCNSLTDVNDRGFLFEGQYMGNRFTNFSSFNLPIQNYHFDGSGSTYNAQSSVGCGGIKRYSCGDYSDDVSWDDSPNGAYGSDQILLFDSPVEPHVKRRQSDESQRFDCLLSDNRSEGERSESRLSLNSNASNNSAASDTVPSLPSGVSGALDILSFPSEWSSYAVDKTGYVNISFSSPEGQSILKFFHRTSKFKDSYLSISSIIRVENPFLHTLYLLKKEEMILRNGHVDELFLYHGTKRRFVSSICENNLDWRQYSEMHRFGKGVSFSPSATYSSHYSDDRGKDKVLMIFKVLVSKSVLGLPEMKIPVDDESESFDTSIKEDATVVVKYCDNEFYPLYKILYTKKEIGR